MMSYFVFPALWGLAAYCSWIGWGLLISKWVDGKQPVGPEICAAWGMTAMLAIGGPLNATETCGYTASISLVMGGLAILVWERGRSVSLLRTTRFSWEQWPYVLLLTCAIFVYGAGVCWMRAWNVFDDFAAYLLYPAKMLARGAAIDPFSLRRLSTFGGYAFLQTIASPFGWPRHAFQLDIGVGAIGVCAIVVTFLRRQGESRVLCVLAGIACLDAPIERVNTTSTELTIFILLGLFCTLELRDRSPASARRRLLIVVAAIAAGMGTIRPNLLPTGAIALCITLFVDLQKRRITWREASTDFFLCAATGVIILVPWCIALYRATGSPFWPLFRGSANPNVNFTNAHLSAGSLLIKIIGFFLNFRALIALAAGLPLLFWPQRNAVAMMLAALGATVLTISGFTLAGESDLLRYTLPMILSASIASVLAMLMATRPQRVKEVGRLLVLSCSAVLFLRIAFNHDPKAAFIESWRNGALKKEYALDEVCGDYSSSQAAIPAGSRVITLTNFPVLFDFKRNEIFTLDFAGMASPPPGLPIGQGNPQWISYLRSESIDYLIGQNDSGYGLASRASWRQHVIGVDTGDRMPTDIPIARTAIRTIDDLQKLRDVCPTVFDNHRLWILRISPGPAGQNATALSPGSG